MDKALRIFQNEDRQYSFARSGSGGVTKINNRRYLGNKYKLLPFIKEVVDSECKDIEVFADIFSGTGAVASAFTDKKLITNDILYSNYICHVAWFGNEAYSREKIGEIIKEYNNERIDEENYMTVNFAGTYFSRENCSKIGYIRQDIEERYLNATINGRERAILITALLYGMDKIANTCGHYDAYRKNAELEKELKLALPVPEKELNPDNICYNMDANELVKMIRADLVYIDPPYNSRQYCDSYHLLENVAQWKKPKVIGVAKKMDRSSLKSDYCTNKAKEAFTDLIAHIRAKYILFSYNNMGEKGDGRSNARMSDRDILEILEKKGRVKIFSQSYKPFSAGKSDIEENEERLFLCICDKNEDEKEKKGDLIKSPVNYTGGKYKLLPQLLPLFPDTNDVVVDLFCGGCDVGINTPGRKIIFNDHNNRLIELLKTLKNADPAGIMKRLFKIIDDYGLSRSDLNGYAHYGCNSSEGLASFNKDRYLRMRRDFNAADIKNRDYDLLFYLLIVYGFNNQIRFNSAGAFNLPVGKRDFNRKLQKKLTDFIKHLRNIDCEFFNQDFRLLDPALLKEASFVYADPPYLITLATYNERNGWTENDERDLLELLDKVHGYGVKFALSNVLTSGKRENRILKDWIERRHFKVVRLDMNYGNSNYHKNDRSKKEEEILVRNY